MREYDDDNIRLYAPVLQRVIILAAVIIAVPVMMWTITTFIRSYVARPKVPTFQHVTVSEPAQSPPPAAALAASPAPPPAAPPVPPRAAPPPALADAGTTANDGRASISDRAPISDAGHGPAQGPMLESPPPDAGPVAIAPVTGLPHAPQPVTPVAAAPPSPTSAASGPPSGPPSSPAAAAPAPSAPLASPVPPAAAQPAQTQPAGAAPRIAANTSGSTPAAPGKGGLAWPNPNADSPPSFGGSPQTLATTTQTASTEAPPAAAPVAGHIPLPRHRPNVVTAAATESIASTAPTGPVSTAPLSTGRVPLPRVRPADTPADTSPVTTAPYGYDPGLGGGH